MTRTQRVEAGVIAVRKGWMSIELAARLLDVSVAEIRMWSAPTKGGQA